MTTLDLGPQVPEDPPFVARMRLHQSWYRAAVLGVPPGIGPTPRSGRRLGSMLPPDAADAGANFLTPTIYAEVQRRLAAGAGIEPYRCLHNLLSSQPMCVNLFAPLATDHTLATHLLQAWLGDEVGTVTTVIIEHAPVPRREYLDDRTAFDAFIGYRRSDGTRAFLAVETKLTEDFDTIADARDRYDELTRADDSPWRPDAFGDLSTGAHNQLWRNHLLAEAVRRHPDQPYDAARLVVVYHPRDPTCAQTLSSYQDTLRDPASTFVAAPLDELVACWSSVASDTGTREWLDAFTLRYLDLSRSEPYWTG